VVGGAAGAAGAAAVVVVVVVAPRMRTILHACTARLQKPEQVPRSAPCTAHHSTPTRHVTSINCPFPKHAPHLLLPCGGGKLNENVLEGNPACACSWLTCASGIFEPLAASTASHNEEPTASALLYAARQRPSTPVCSLQNMRYFQFCSCETRTPAKDMHLVARGECA
jgi:hypothetical protein